MLILTRRAGQGVDLVDSATNKILATVQVLDFLPNDVVRLGFEADARIHILRDNAKQRQRGEDGDGETY